MLQKIEEMRADLHYEYGAAQRAKKLFAVLLNPSVRASALIRAATCNRKFLYVLARNMLIALHSIDVGPNLKVGAPLILPHPLGIVLGSGANIGSGVVIYQGVTIGAKNGGYPRIEDDVTIYPGAIVVGAIVVGRGSRIGAGAFIDKDVRAGTVTK